MTSDLRLVRALCILRGLRFGFAVWVLYYLRFTDYAGIGLAETCTIIAAFTLEVPTGVLADRWGRRPTLVASFATEALGYFLLAAATGLSTLLLALVTLQVGRALFSGTFEAFVWESLAEQGEQASYTRRLGRLRGAGLAAIAPATIAGGYLYRLDPRLPYLAAGAAFAAAAATALRLEEPVRAAARDVAPARLDRHGQAPLWLALAPLVLLTVFHVPSDEVLDDALAVDLGFAPQQLGFLFAAAYLFAAFASARSESFGRSRSSGAVFALAACAGATLALSPRLGLLGGGVFIVLRYGLRAIHDNLAARRVSSLAASARRATTISLFKAASALPYVVLAYWMGTRMDGAGVRSFAGGLGLLQLVAVVPIWWLARLLRATAAARPSQEHESAPDIRDGPG